MRRRLAHLAVILLAVTQARPAGLADQGRTSGSRAAGATGRIVGRVTDASGRPARGTFVSILFEDERDSRHQPALRPVNVRLYSIADEGGEFRLENVPSGAYCVVAVPRNAPIGPGGRPNRSGSAITYYPSAVKSADARLVTVSRAAEATANITLAPARLSVIAGSVTRADGQPARSARLAIAHGNGLFGLDSMATTTRPDGTFAIAGTPPGTYHLHAREGAWPPPLDVIPKVSVARVTVVDRDLTDVRVVPTPMVRATGRLVVDPEARRSMKPSGITVGASPVDFDGNPGPTRPGTLHNDLTFEFRTWPGPAYVRVSPASQWIIKAIRLNGLDITNTGIDFRSGRDIDGLEITVIPGASR
jgi:hypothetical protein